MTVTQSTVTQAGTTHSPTLTAPNNCNGTYTVKLTVKDGNGCSSQQVSKSVTVKDVTAPTLKPNTSWPANITGQNNCYANRDISGLYSNNQVKNLFADGCGGTITVTSSDAQTSTSNCGWTVTRTYTIKFFTSLIFVT